MPEKKVKLALFDIDGTIFRSSLLIELINGLIEHGVFPKGASPEMERTHLAWLDRTGHYDDYLWKVVKVHLKYIKGCNWNEVVGVVEKVMRNHKDHVYRYTRDLVKSLKKKGYTLVAISGSPVYLVERFAKYMRFDYAFGQNLEIKNGLFTGKIVNMDFREKEKVLKSFVAREGWDVDPVRGREGTQRASASNGVDWKNSMAVGDTDNDIPMLKMVGNPVAFNPNRTFAKYAMKHGWNVVVERKDSIYQINTCSILDYEGMV